MYIRSCNIKEITKVAEKNPEKLIENLKFINRCQNLILIT